VQARAFALPLYRAHDDDGGNASRAETTETDALSAVL